MRSGGPAEPRGTGPKEEKASIAKARRPSLTIPPRREAKSNHSTLCRLAQPISPFDGLPPHAQAKLQRLTEIRAQSLKGRRLSDEQIRTDLNSGDAPTIIRNLSPEAANLLQDIATALKGRYTEEQLAVILGGRLEIK